MEKSSLIPPITRRQFIKGALATSAVLAASSADFSSTIKAQLADEIFKLPDLPYPDNALEPYISAKTISFHYGKHHKAYLDNINKLVKGTDLAQSTLEEITKKTAGKQDLVSIFNNASQAWNHSFYWKSMKPGGGGAPTDELAKKITKTFVSFDKFKEEFANAALTQFGSGWAWLAVDKGSLKVVKTSNADSPLTSSQIPLITIDVWEHAYYLDYQNRRKDYISDFLEHLVNWDFAAETFKNIP